jgi:hypothetical protein
MYRIMKLSVHSTIRGKPEKVKGCGNAHYFVSEDYKVNLGYNWVNIECDWDQAFELITVDGLATSAELLSDHRTDDNFVSRQLCMVDIDNGMTIQQLFEDNFYNEYGAGFYTTASHTEEHHRFRVMFVTEEPIIDKETMKKIIRGLLIVYESADKSCKDASRIYYGVKNCQLKEFRTNILPKEVTDALIQIVEEQDAEKNKQLTSLPKREFETPDENFVDELLRRIQMIHPTFKGDYYTWRNVAWATCSAVGVGVAKYLMMRYWPVKTKECLQSFSSWQASSSPTLGTLVKLSNISKVERQLLEIQLKMRKLK